MQADQLGLGLHPCNPPLGRASTVAKSIKIAIMLLMQTTSLRVNSRIVLEGGIKHGIFAQEDRVKLPK